MIARALSALRSACTSLLRVRFVPMKSLLVIAAVALIACGGKKSAPATTPPPAAAQEGCCCTMPAQGDDKTAAPMIMKTEECKAAAGTCEPEVECHGITEPMP